MPTTLLDGESYPQALARRRAEEDAIDTKIRATAKEPCPSCGMDWSRITVLPGACPECGASTLPF